MHAHMHALPAHARASPQAPLKWNMPLILLADQQAVIVLQQAVLVWSHVCKRNGDLRRVQHLVWLHACKPNGDLRRRTDQGGARAIALRHGRHGRSLPVGGEAAAIGKPARKAAMASPTLTVSCKPLTS
jgi:hypothetical protein